MISMLKWMYIDIYVYMYGACVYLENKLRCFLYDPLQCNTLNADVPFLLPFYWFLTIAHCMNFLKILFIFHSTQFLYQIPIQK